MCGRRLLNDGLPARAEQGGVILHYKRWRPSLGTKTRTHRAGIRAGKDAENMSAGNSDLRAYASAARDPYLAGISAKLGIANVNLCSQVAATTDATNLRLAADPDAS